ncbi:MAG: DUF2808 domain-containing protein, partial [Cyanobacteria bacterium]|nr:DUF2808 domain-containing protein [Cyanobacteriota bacterium]
MQKRLTGLIKRLLPLSAFSLVLLSPLSAPDVRAQSAGSSSGFEFRWNNDRDFRKLYYFLTLAEAKSRSDYYLVLGPKDRKTALLKLAISVPSYFDSQITPADVRLCTIKQGSIVSRTRCLETIPATVEVSSDGTAIEIFPDRPVPTGTTIGVYMQIFNPSAGM